MNQSRTAKKLAVLLVIPAILITGASCFLLPWMIETKQRLQNHYWETQLALAITSLSLASAGLPSLIIRIVSRARALAIACWIIVALGYLAIFSYVVQSHFALDVKAVVAPIALSLAATSGYGLALEGTHGRKLALISNN